MTNWMVMLAKIKLASVLSTFLKVGAVGAGLVLLEGLGGFPGWVEVATACIAGTWWFRGVLTSYVGSLAAPTLQSSEAYIQFFRMAHSQLNLKTDYSIHRAHWKMFDEVREDPRVQGQQRTEHLRPGRGDL